MNRNIEPKAFVVLLFGRSFNDSFRLHFRLLLARLEDHGAQIYFFEPFLDFVRESLEEEFSFSGSFTNSDDLPVNADYMLSIGGDGTFLEAATIVRNKDIPIAGINAGRLGFLADIAQEEISTAIDSISHGLYNTEERTLIQLRTDQELFGDFNFALNELTVHKRDDSSMIKIKAFLDGEYLNTYWTDGLIVSTPTGSTAYSLSVGGPLVVPDANDFIIAPIAPHNLTVRPLVYPDRQELTLQMEGRGGHILVSLDSRSVVVESGLELKISKAPFVVKTLRLKDHSFYNTLRTKLMWGADKRN